ncbi:hypothetical protein F5B20DRAFT_548586 [Whalleya microplaca]|nr:hypothetical protein F5B20DRAFT_548586 [Whalleya microplaca]
MMPSATEPSLGDFHNLTRDQSQGLQETAMEATEQAAPAAAAAACPDTAELLIDFNTPTETDPTNTSNYSADLFDFDEQTGVKLLPKRPTKNPHSKSCSICALAGNDDCRHWRILSKDQMFREYDYEGYKRDPEEWSRNFHKLPNIEGMQADDGTATTAAAANTPSPSTSQDSSVLVSLLDEQQTDSASAFPALIDGPSSEATNDSSSALPAPMPFPLPMEPEPEPEIAPPQQWEPPKDRLVPKFALPQNDPDFRPLLDRDEGGFVRQSEVNAIMERRTFRTIPMSEVRERYSGIVKLREEQAAWARGDW